MVEIVIPVREVSLTGGLHVKRILPFRSRRMVGPFAFLDEMGPIEVKPGISGDVPPHPHIGLSTVTYLYSGELLHRDSLKIVQPILPGELNWMTSGKGIAHSERIPEELRKKGGPLHGLQAWVALPEEFEEVEPSFQHVGEKDLPHFEIDGAKIRLIAGSAFGKISPVKTYSRLFYFCADIPQGKALKFDPENQEAALYIVRGDVNVGGQTYSSPAMLVFETGRPIEIQASTEVLGMFLGGDSVGQRTIWWNFVSSSKERIEQAKDDWRERRFPEIPGEHDSLPLPGDEATRIKSTMP